MVKTKTTDKSPLRQLAERLKFWVGIPVAVIVAGGSVAAAIGFEIDRPAWFEEVQEVAGGVSRNRCEILDFRISSIRRQRYANGREQRQYGYRNQRIPESLHRERVKLNADINKLNKQFSRFCLSKDR